MWTHIWFKLTSAFALIIVIGLLISTVLTRQGAATHFAHFMVEHHMIRPEVMVQTLADYYSQHHDWNETNIHLPLLIETASDGMMSGMVGSMMGMNENRIQVIDSQNRVIADTLSKGNASNTMLTGQVVQRWPIVVDTREVGSLLVEGAMMTASPLRNQRLLQGVTRAVLLAGLTTGLIAVVLAWLLVRQITSPLATLTAASAQIAKGDLAARVIVQSHDELGILAKTFNQMAMNLQTQEMLRRNLVADVAHELRTPLAGIQGTVEAIQDGVFPLTIEQVGSIHEQVILLNRLVEDLRTLANADAGQLVLDRIFFDLVPICETQVQAFQAQAISQQIDLHLIIKDNSPLIYADPQRIGQVLVNLLGNALRHTPTGGIVEMSLSTTTQGVEVAVTDNGEGISADELPHIFDRFYRTDRSRNRQNGGSGLGLAIARQLVEVHGGKLWAESPAPGCDNGSRFTVVLPQNV